jgi:hypothetical protein
MEVNNHVYTVTTLLLKVGSWVAYITDMGIIVMQKIYASVEN